MSLYDTYVAVGNIIKMKSIFYLKFLIGFINQILSIYNIVSFSFPVAGEAAAGKTGERYILNLRQTLETERGDENFNLRLFHKAVLECLGPLDFVEDCVRDRMNPKKNAMTTTSPGHVKPFTTSTTTTAPGPSKTKAPAVIPNSAVNFPSNLKLLIIVGAVIFRLNNL